MSIGKFVMTKGQAWSGLTLKNHIGAIFGSKPQLVSPLTTVLLQNSGMKEKLDELVLEKETPVIGICVGMQMLAHSSDEGKLPGLGWVDATVKKFDITKIPSTTRLPHMGWNTVKPVMPVNPLFDGFDEESSFYFLHSYYFSCNNPADIIATADYGGPYACAINHKNIYGVQCHPEKSHHDGVKLLQNFSKL